MLNVLTVIIVIITPDSVTKYYFIHVMEKSETLLCYVTTAGGYTGTV
jgi:hypothetical protein